MCMFRFNVINYTVAWSPVLGEDKYCLDSLHKDHAKMLGIIWPIGFRKK